RTIVDLASMLDFETLTLALDDAWRRGLTHPREIGACAKRLHAKGRGGIRVLRQVIIDAIRRRKKAFESAAEARFWCRAKTASKELPKVQHRVEYEGRYRLLDFAYADRLLAFEVDSWEYHRSTYRV